MKSSDVIDADEAVYNQSIDLSYQLASIKLTELSVGTKNSPQKASLSARWHAMYDL